MSGNHWSRETPQMVEINEIGNGKRYATAGRIEEAI